MPAFLQAPVPGLSLSRHLLALGRLLVLGVAFLGLAPAAWAASNAELERDARAALAKLYEQHPEAQLLADKARGILVFPRIVKAGLMVGGEYGNGVLFKGERPAGYFNSSGVSYGLQAGAQEYSYVLFFMRDSAMKMLYKREGLEIGVGPSVVVMDEGMGKKLSSTTLDDDVYAYIFGQSGLMAGVGIQGNKITPLKR